MEVSRAAGPAAPRKNRWLVVKLAVSAALLYVITRFVDWTVIAQRLSWANTWVVIGSVVCFVLQGFFATLRWRQVLRAAGTRDPGLRPMLASYFESLFLGQGLPSTVGGDVLRVIHARGWGNSLAQAAYSVMLERLFALAWLIVIGLAGLPWLWGRVEDARSAWIVAGTLACWAALLTGFLLLPVLPAAIGRLPVVRKVMDMSIVALSLQRRGISAGAVALTSIGGHLLTFAGIWLIARGLHLELSFAEIALVMPFVMLIGMIPISVSGWGLREGTMAVALGWFGIAASDAVLLSVLIGLALIVASLPGAAAWLMAWRNAPSRPPA